jgi:hypothetical protein
MAFTGRGVASCLPPPGGDSSSGSSWVRVIFCSPWLISMGINFSQPIGLWSFCSPLLDLVVDVIFLTFKAMEFVHFALFFFFSFFDKKVHLETSNEKLLLSFVSLVERMVELHHFLYFFYARSSLLHRLMRDTRPSDESTFDFWSYCRLHRLCGLPVTDTWPSHTREVSFLCHAWRSRSAFFRSV